MQVPVWVERVPENGYVARNPQYDLAAEGATREQALDNLKQVITARLASGAELVILDIPELENPWKQVAGMYKDDPLFDEWQQAIQEYRQQVENDPNSP